MPMCYIADDSMHVSAVALLGAKDLVPWQTSPPKGRKEKSRNETGS